MRQPIISVSDFPSFLRENSQGLFGEPSYVPSREPDGVIGKFAWCNRHGAFDPDEITRAAALNAEQGAVCIP